MSAITFDERKFQNVVLYFLKNSPVRPGTTVLVKMLFYADYWHYRSNLSSITGSQYVALERGPVPDDYRDLFDDLVEKGIVERQTVPILGVANPKEEFLPMYEPDVEVFSPSELATLDQVIEECGRKSGYALSKMAHREPAWLIAWDAQEPSHKMPYTLFRWMDNWPDERDAERARRGISRPEVSAVIQDLETATVGE